MKSLKEQTPATTNQIQHTRPSINKTHNILQGYFANSQNGGIIKPFKYSPIMAGTQTVERRLQGMFKMLTPKTPVFQRLKAVIETYFVPNKRVWDNAEKFIAQKGGATEQKIKQIPNTGNQALPFIRTENQDIDTVAFTDSDFWRDSWVSTYFPRYQTGATSPQSISVPLPENSILPYRGFIAIYNDMLRNKEYDPEIQENSTDMVNDIIPNALLNHTLLSKYILRGRRQNSYYTDYRTELLGFDGTEPALNTANDLSDLVEWEKLVASARSQAENAQKNDWDILSEIRGSKKLTQGKVQLISRHEIPLNYQAVAQTAYNINENIEQSFQQLGEQGAYSFTEFDIPIVRMTEFEEEGYLHSICTITADTVFETGFDRTNLNVNWDDIYRPDLKELKDDVLYDIEKCGTRLTNNSLKNITGFKRKFSEYFKLPDCISGDLCTRGYYITKFKPVEGNEEVQELTIGEDLTRTEGQRSFQFFEIDDKETANFKKKNIWQDYTDILINENSATMQEVQEVKYIAGIDGERTFLMVKGDNQVFYMGIETAIENLPIDENIKNNFTRWGEK